MTKALIATYADQLTESGHREAAREVTCVLTKIGCPVMVPQLITILQNKKYPSTYGARLVPYRRLHWLTGGGSLLNKPESAWQSFADQPKWPSPVPLEPGKWPSHVVALPHYQSALALAQRWFCQDVTHLWNLANEGIPLEERQPMVRVDPPSRSSLVVRGPERPFTRPLTYEQLKAIRETHGVETRTVDQLQSAAWLAVQRATRFRNGTLFALQGQHLRWRNGLVEKIHPPPGTRDKGRGPQLLGKASEVLTKHLARLPAHHRMMGLDFPAQDGTPFPATAQVFVNMLTGYRLTNQNVGRMVQGVGEAVESAGLTCTDVRAAEMTDQLFRATPLEASKSLNDHRDPDTDWIYRRKMAAQWETPILKELCRISKVSFSLDPPCCLDCGDLEDINANLQCPRCAGTNEIQSVDERPDQVVELTRMLAARIPPEAWRSLRIKIPAEPKA